MPRHLIYNDLIYVPKEDFSYFRVMLYRPDKNGYLLECCDPRQVFGVFYKMIYIDQLEEKAILTIDKMKEFWETEIRRLILINDKLRDEKYSPDKNLEAKIKDIQYQINCVSKSLEIIKEPTLILKKEKAIKEMQKGIRRLQKKENCKYLAYQEKIDLQISKNSNQIRKYEEDRTNLNKILNTKEKFETYASDTFIRRVFGNSVK